VLNEGNVKASYGNASITSNPVLSLTGESTSYIGEIAENSPVPFTLSAIVKSSTADGNYPVTIMLFYQDDQYQNHSINITMTLTVAKSQSGQSTQSSSGSMTGFLKDNGLTIALLAVASACILLIYRRRTTIHVSKISQ
jgi:hypothetical protein